MLVVLDDPLSLDVSQDLPQQREVLLTQSGRKCNLSFVTVA